MCQQHHHLHHHNQEEEKEEEAVRGGGGGGGRGPCPPPLFSPPPAVRGAASSSSEEEEEAAQPVAVAVAAAKCKAKESDDDECRCNCCKLKGEEEPHMVAPLIPKSPTWSTHTQHPSSSLLLEATREAISIAKIALPMILTGLLLYSRSMISMLFLGRLGDLALAGGSLALGFANITGYSILSGLAMGMEPICGQAFGAKRHSLLGLSLQRTVLLLLLSSLPISFLWLNVRRILLLCGQDPDIAAHAHSFLLHSLPDLLTQSLLHPLRIYLRSQSITLPLTLCASLSILLHLPINYLLVSRLHFGLPGVALSAVLTNFALLASLLLYLALSGLHRPTWPGLSPDCLRHWAPLLTLAVPSCISVCLEWWWYEIMILLCGLLPTPRATLASMGILIQTTSLIYIFPSSLSFSVSTRVSNELGANRPAKAKRAAIVGLVASFALGLSALTFAVMVRNAWAGMFTRDAEIAALTSAVLPILGLCELGNCPQTTGCGVLRGTARPRVGANINLGCFYLVGTPVAVGLAFYAGFDFQGLWLGLLAAQASCVLTMLLVLNRTDWEMEARRAKQLTSESLLVLTDDDDDDDDHPFIKQNSQCFLGDSDAPPPPHSLV